MSVKCPPKLEAILTQKPKDLKQDGDEVKSMKFPGQRGVNIHLLHCSQSSHVVQVCKITANTGCAAQLVSTGCYMAREASAYLSAGISATHYCATRARAKVSVFNFLKGSFSGSG